MHLLLSSGLIVFVLATLTRISSGAHPEEKMLDALLKGYNPEYRGNENATDISVNMYIRSFNSIDEVKMEYSVQITFRLQWLDQRLRYNNFVPQPNVPYLTLTKADKIWTPDLFFSNEKSGHTHNLLKPNQYIRIFPDGQVLYSIRLTLTLSCPMILKDFPFDTQTCSMRMASYGWTTADIILKWKKYDPVMVTPEMHIPNFALKQFTTDYCDSHTNTGVYSCLRVDFELKRDLNVYLTQVFIPSTVLVIMAWFSFWLSKTEVVGRLLLILTTILMMIFGIRVTIKTWTGSCLTFIFFALMEFIIVNFLARRESESPVTVTTAAVSDSWAVNQYQQRQVKEWWNIREFYHKLTWADRIDIAARIIYPIAFLIFFVAYMGKFYFISI